MTRPSDIPQDVWDEAVRCTGPYGGHEMQGVIHAQRVDIARALLTAKRESEAEIDRLNAVIARMQSTMSSQAEQWSRSMAVAKREGMEKAAEIADEFCSELERHEGHRPASVGAKGAAQAIRQAAKEIEQ